MPLSVTAGFADNVLPLMLPILQTGTIADNLVPEVLPQEGPAQHVPAVTTETVDRGAPAVLRLA